MVVFHSLHQSHCNFQNSYKNQLIKNKNGSGSYDFSQDNYNAGLCGSGYTLKKNKRDIPQGDPTYDSARANMGEPWMMFTKDQVYELTRNTYHGWTTINGINGYKFFNKTDLSIYIFLPAAGSWRGTSYSSDNSYGQYFSTTIYDWSSLEAWYLYFYSTSIITHNAGQDYGSSIRGIRPQ